VLGDSLKSSVLHVPAGGEFNGHPSAAPIL
jgi:hypothetical protein